MSEPVAKFQSASAFFGVGFTTQEAELVVNHPVRRRIILHLIIAGNIGLTSALATLIVTFVHDTDRGVAVTFGWLSLVVLGAVLVGLTYHLPLIHRPVDKLMRVTLERVGLNRVVDYDYLLNLRDGFCVYDGEIHPGHPWIGKSFKETRPSDHGVVVLGIYRSDGEFVGAPDKDTVVRGEDILMVYGQEDRVKEAFKRPE